HRSPAAFRAYLNRGQALLRAGQPDRALADFDAVLSLRPGLLYAQVNRGIALVQLQRYVDALAAFDEGVTAGSKIPPEARARAHSTGAALLLVRGRPRAPRADLLGAAAPAPARAESRLNAEGRRAEIGR